MMKFMSFSSGSKGNCSFIGTDNVKLIIDAGVTFGYLEKQLIKNDIDIDEISGVLITHIHSDHIKGLKQFVKKMNWKVYIPDKMKKEVLEFIDDEYIEVIDDFTNMIDLNINLIYTSHDTECSVGYLFESDNTSLVYITDTGYINRKYLKLIDNKSVYFLESNHDEAMLMDGPYPYYLKQRVISDSGHLSNNMAAKYLSLIVGDKTKCIILAHVSEKNNTYDLAYDTIRDKLDMISYNGELFVAKQDEVTKLVEV